jgi:hypothetical protein
MDIKTKIGLRIKEIRTEKELMQFTIYPIDLLK